MYKIAPEFRYIDGTVNYNYSAFIWETSGFKFKGWSGGECYCKNDCCKVDRYYILNKIYWGEPVLEEIEVSAEEFCPFTNVVMLPETDISDVSITLPADNPLPHCPRAISAVNQGYGQVLTFRLNEASDVYISVRCDDTGTTCQKFSKLNLDASAGDEKYAYVWDGKGCCDNVPECVYHCSNGCYIGSDGGDLDTVAKEGNYSFVITAQAVSDDWTKTQEISFKVKYDFENRETKNCDAQEFIILNDDEFSGDEELSK